MSILSRRCKVPHLSLERYRIREQVLESVSAEFARANHVMPLERLGKVLNVAGGAGAVRGGIPRHREGHTQGVLARQDRRGRGAGGDSGAGGGRRGGRRGGPRALRRLAADSPERG